MLQWVAKVFCKVGGQEKVGVFRARIGLDELFKAYHRMCSIEATQLVEFLVAEIIHRDQITLAVRIDAFHAPEFYCVMVNVPIHRFKENIHTMIRIVERRITVVLFRAENHHCPFLVVITKTKIVVIDGISFNTCFSRVSEIDTH